MSPRTIRRLVQVVAVAGIVGMIVSSIAEENGVAVSFGIVTALAVSALILVTTVAGPEAFGRRHGFDEELAAEVEASIGALVDAGADEGAVRATVRRAVELGRRAGPPPPPA